MQQYSHGGASPSQAANTTYPVPMVSNTFTRETISGGPSNAWTVEEQIYKSKMWLQQRNQSMLPKPWLKNFLLNAIFWTRSWAWTNVYLLEIWQLIYIHTEIETKIKTK